MQDARFATLFANLLDADTGQPLVQPYVTKSVANEQITLIGILSAELFSYDPVTPLERYPGPKLSVFPPFGDQSAALHNLIPSLPRQRMDNVSHWPMLWTIQPNSIALWISFLRRYQNNARPLTDGSLSRVQASTNEEEPGIGGPLVQS